MRLAKLSAKEIQGRLFRCSGLVLFTLALGGCGTNASHPENLFDSEGGVEVGQKLEVPEGDTLSAIGDAFASQSTSYVLCFLSTECDATNRVLGRLKSIRKKNSDTEFVGFVTSAKSRLAGFEKATNLGFELFGDFEQQAANLLGANRTPAFFVFDSDRVLVYKGPIDDSTLVAADAKKHWLASAISAAAKGQQAPASMPFIGTPIVGEH